MKVVDYGLPDMLKVVVEYSEGPEEHKESSFYDMTHVNTIDLDLTFRMTDRHVDHKGV